MNSSRLVQDEAVDTPANINQMFDKLFETTPSSELDKVSSPSEVEVHINAGSLVLDCDTQCPPAQSDFYVGTVWQNGVRNQWGPYRAPFRAIIVNGCGGVRYVGFVCGNQTTGPFVVNVCYASLTVCRCA